MRLVGNVLRFVFTILTFLRFKLSSYVTKDITEARACLQVHLTFVKHDASRIQITYGIQAQKWSSHGGRTCPKHLPHSIQSDALQPPDILPNGFGPRRCPRQFRWCHRSRWNGPPSIGGICHHVGNYNLFKHTFYGTIILIRGFCVKKIDAYRTEYFSVIDV